MHQHQPEKFYIACAHKYYKCGRSHESRVSQGMLVRGRHVQTALATAHCTR